MLTVERQSMVGRAVFALPEIPKLHSVRICAIEMGRGTNSNLLSGTVLLRNRRLQRRWRKARRNLLRQHDVQHGSS
jgi:hypothetical protein